MSKSFEEILFANAKDEENPTPVDETILLEELKKNFDELKEADQLKALLYAAKNNHIPLAEFLLEKKVNPNAGYIASPFLDAVGHNNRKIVELFLRSEWPLNYTEAFFMAVSLNHKDIVETLLNDEKAKVNGVKVNLSNSHYPNPLFASVWRNVFEGGVGGYPKSNGTATTELLLNAGVNLYQTNQHGSIFTFANADSTRLILEKMKSSKQPFDQAYLNQGLFDRINSFAKYSDDAEVIKLLFDAGANVNGLQNDSGESAVIAAANNGSPEVVEVLLDRKVSVDKNKVKDFCFKFLKGHDQNKIGCVLSFLKKGTVSHADAHYINEEEREDIFSCALKNGVARVAEFCLKNGAEITDANATFTVAIRHRNGEMIKILFDNKIDENLVGKNVKDLFIEALAVKDQSPEVVKSFLDTKRVDANRCADGKTPLFYAAKMGNKEVINLLIKNGAKINEALAHNDQLDEEQQLASMQDTILKNLNRETGYFLAATLEEGDLRNSVINQFMARPLTEKKIFGLEKLQDFLLKKNFSEEEMRIVIADVADHKVVKKILGNYTNRLQMQKRFSSTDVDSCVMGMNVNYFSGIPYDRLIIVDKIVSEYLAEPANVMPPSPPSPHIATSSSSSASNQNLTNNR